MNIYDAKYKYPKEDAKGYCDIAPDSPPTVRSPVTRTRELRHGDPLRIVVTYRPVSQLVDVHITQSHPLDIQVAGIEHCV